MKQALSWCFEEFKRIIPVTLFFFVAFLLVHISTEKLTLDIKSTYTLMSIAVAALIMGKVVFITDHLGITELFSHKPLIYNTFWKSLLYMISSMILRLVEHVIPALFDDTSWHTIYQLLVEHVERPVFWVGQMWLTYLFLIFVSARELIYYVGPAKVKKLFFGD